MDRAMYRLESKGRKQLDTIYENPPSMANLKEFLSSSEFRDGFKVMNQRSGEIIDEAKKYIDILNIDKNSEWGSMAQEGIKMAETLKVISDAFGVMKTDL